MIAACMKLIVCWFVLVGGFAIVMHAKEMKRRGALSRFWTINFAPWVLAGGTMDILFNLTVGTIMFREAPHELMFSSRIERWHDADKPSWRRERADWWAKKLNAVEVGHIR